MPPRAWRNLPERELHERVAEVEGHASQVRGIVGYFYRVYQFETLKRVKEYVDIDVLEIGCGEGMMFNGSGIHPVQTDISLTRLQRALGRGRRLVCADAYDLPFPNESFQLVLLVAVLEHTREPWRILGEVYRVLRPRGQVIIVVPNDLAMSVGRLLLLKFPARYPDHLTFTTPRRLSNWLAEGFEIRESFPLPFPSIGFFLNLYYFVVAQKHPG